MPAAPLPPDEPARRRALRRYDLLDTAPEPGFDQITALASRLCGRPIALVSLIDDERQWLKSRHGTDLEETPRSEAFCAWTILGDEVLEVPDARVDARFVDNPHVIAGGVVFYAGTSLRTPDGHNVGTLCVVDDQPGRLTDEQRDSLRMLGEQVVGQMELRRHVARCEAQIDELEQFAYRTSHDLKAPVLRIRALTRMAMYDLEHGDLDEVRRNAGVIMETCDRAADLVEGIVDVTRAEVEQHDPEPTDVPAVVRQVLEDAAHLAEADGVLLDWTGPTSLVVAMHRVRLVQILSNLVSNGIRYHDPAQALRRVHVTVSVREDVLHLEVADNGVGIPPQHREVVFEPFSRVHPDSAAGSGLGLPIVRKHVAALDGTVTLTSSPAGTTFAVELPIPADRSATAPMSHLHQADVA